MNAKKLVLVYQIVLIMTREIFQVAQKGRNWPFL